MRHIIKVLTALAAVMIAAVILPIVVSVLAFCFILIVGLFIAHIFGLPIVIKEDGHVIGEVRRFVFYKK